MRPAIVALCSVLFAGQTIAHTFVEQLQIIGDDGVYTGPMGYMRSFTDRGKPGFDQKKNLYQVPPLDRASRRINDQDLVCHPDQQTPKYNEGLPMLKAAPGNFVAVKYLENGHTTHVDPGLDGAKAEGSGSVYLFATFEPKVGEKMIDILQWTRDGKGGDGRGKLLIAQDYDDQRCYQIPSTVETEYYKERVAKYPNGGELWCESDLPLPADLEVGKTLTVYWVWDWPSFGADNKDEYYNSCMDIEIVAEIPTEAPIPLMQQDKNTKAVAEYKSRTAVTNTPRTVGSEPTATSGPDGGPQAPAETPAAPEKPEEEPAASPSPPVSAPPTIPTTPPAQGAVDAPPEADSPAPTSPPPEAAPPASSPATPPPADTPAAAPPAAAPPSVCSTPAAPTPAPPVAGAPEAAIPTLSGRPDQAPAASGEAGGMTTIIIKETVYVTGPPAGGLPPASTPAPAAPAASGATPPDAVLAGPGGVPAVPAARVRRFTA